MQFSVNVDVPQHNWADNQEQISWLDISLGHFESFVSASPEAPVFSPITPQHTCSILSVADTTGLPTPSLTQSLSPPPALVTLDKSPLPSTAVLQGTRSANTCSPESVPLPLVASSPTVAKKWKWSGF